MIMLGSLAKLANFLFISGKREESFVGSQPDEPRRRIPQECGQVPPAGRNSRQPP
jgi:hypothetical protein